MRTKYKKPRGVSEGMEEYSLGCVIGQNLFLVAYFGVGFLGMLPLRFAGIPIASLIYAFFLALMLIFVLRKHLCTSCYYYGKICHVGWSKLALMFKKNSGNRELGFKLASITWFLATIFPIVGILVVLFISRSIETMVLFLIFIMLTPINFLIHKKACKTCKERDKCKLSMAKSGS